MTGLQDLFGRTDTITFDCYGTLIDWKEGLSRSFRTMFGPGIENRLGELFDIYLSLEAQVEGEPYRGYRQVLEEVSVRLAHRLGVELPDDHVGVLARTLPTWALFADTNDALVRLKQRYRLGVLSNIDRDLFAATASRFPVTFDFVVTAQDVRAYKPDPNHFHRMLERHGGAATTLHVAQSLFHDGAPAQALGLAFVWINRYGEMNRTAVQPLAEFKDLSSLADRACNQ